ncbi:Acetyl xylan esterase (AXE1) [Streptomyces sp. ADI96-02]|nr:Acetyl xylan esterase (AXE1) [Streptomyces sp. ADI96-02]
MVATAPDLPPADASSCVHGFPFGSVSRFVHDFPFDPACGSPAPDELLGIAAPSAREDVDAFWRSRYERARRVAVRPEVGPVEEERDGVRVRPVTYSSVGGVRPGGRLVLPADRPVRYGFVVGHGYGGRREPGPDVPLPLPGAAAILPCVRGMGERGRVAGVPEQADEHVPHGIGFVAAAAARVRRHRSYRWPVGGQPQPQLARRVTETGSSSETGGRPGSASRCTSNSTACSPS